MNPFEYMALIAVACKRCGIEITDWLVARVILLYDDGIHVAKATDTILAEFGS